MFPSIMFAVIGVVAILLAFGSLDERLKKLENAENDFEECKLTDLYYLRCHDRLSDNLYIFPFFFSTKEKAEKWLESHYHHYDQENNVWILRDIEVDIFKGKLDEFEDNI